jgi:hypothetical protein
MSNYCVCGKAISDLYKYCHYCGKDLEKDQPLDLCITNFTKSYKDSSSDISFSFMPVNKHNIRILLTDLYRKHDQYKSLKIFLEKHHNYIDCELFMEKYGNKKYYCDIMPKTDKYSIFDENEINIRYNIFLGRLNIKLPIVSVKIFDDIEFEFIDPKFSKNTEVLESIEYFKNLESNNNLYPEGMDELDDYTGLKIIMIGICLILIMVFIDIIF